MRGTKMVADTLPATPCGRGEHPACTKALRGGTWLDVLRDMPQTGHRFGRALPGCHVSLGGCPGKEGHGPHQLCQSRDLRGRHDDLLMLSYFFSGFMFQKLFQEKKRP